MEKPSHRRHNMAISTRQAEKFELGKRAGNSFHSLTGKGDKEVKEVEGGLKTASLGGWCTPANYCSHVRRIKNFTKL